MGPVPGTDRNGNWRPLGDDVVESEQLAFGQDTMVLTKGKNEQELIGMIIGLVGEERVYALHRAVKKSAVEATNGGKDHAEILGNISSWLVDVMPDITKEVRCQLCGGHEMQIVENRVMAAGNPTLVCVVVDFYHFMCSCGKSSTACAKEVNKGTAGVTARFYLLGHIKDGKVVFASMFFDLWDQPILAAVPVVRPLTN